MAKGYTWSLDGPLPLIEDHSRAKHDVLKAYLVNYLRILAQSPRSEGIKVTLVDGFAGGGQYQTPTGSIASGSPLILLEALKEARALVALDRQQRGIRTPYVIDATIHLVEQERATFDYLVKLIQGTSDAHQTDTRVTVHHGAFDQKLPEIIQDIRSRQKKSGRSVFILDQYGWSQVNLATVQSIFSQFQSAEVFLTWMIDNLVNFLSDQMVGKLDAALKRTGLGDHLTAEHLLSIKNGGHLSDGDGDGDGDVDVTWRRAIQSLMTAEIRSSSGANYSTPFYIVPKSSRRGYWLLHLAQHLRANEEMKRIHWQNNNLHHPGGPGFNMLGFVGSNGQLAFDNRFDEHSSKVTMESLREDIPRRIAELNSPIRFGELVELTANETPAHLQHIQEAVFALARERNLTVRTPTGSVRRTAHSLASDDVIEIPTQLWLLPNPN